METINDRMQQIADTKFGGNKAAFARAIGIAETSITNYIGGKRRSKPSSDLLARIVNQVDVDARWLLTGKGQMSKWYKEDVNKELLMLCQQLIGDYRRSEAAVQRLETIVDSL